MSLFLHHNCLEFWWVSENFDKKIGQMYCNIISWQMASYSRAWELKLGWWWGIRWWFYYSIATAAVNDTNISIRLLHWDRGMSKPLIKCKNMQHYRILWSNHHPKKVMCQLKRRAKKHQLIDPFMKKHQSPMNAGEELKHFSATFTKIYSFLR